MRCLIVRRQNSAPHNSSCILPSRGGATDIAVSLATAAPEDAYSLGASTAGRPVLVVCLLGRSSHSQVSIAISSM